MAKRNTVLTSGFRLTKGAEKLLNRYIDEIRKGVINVCELHTHDSLPSMSKGNFEKTYIEKTLGQTVMVVSLSERAMIDGLAAQKEKELNNIMQVDTLAKK